MWLLKMFLWAFIMFNIILNERILMLQVFKTLCVGTRVEYQNRKPSRHTILLFVQNKQPFSSSKFSTPYPASNHT